MNPDSVKDKATNNTITIDMTPTWGELGCGIERLVFSGETRALKGMWPEARKAFAMAQGLKVLVESGTLSDEQKEQAMTVVAAEIAKQGRA